MTRDGVANNLTYANSSEVVYDVQHFDLTTILESVMDKVHRPDLIRAERFFDGDSHNIDLLSSRTMADLELLLAIDTESALAVHDKAFPLQDSVDRNNSPAFVAISQFLHAND